MKNEKFNDPQATSYEAACVTTKTVIMTVYSVLIGVMSGLVYSFLFSSKKGSLFQPPTVAGGLGINTAVMSGFFLRYSLLLFFLYQAWNCYDLDLASWVCGFLPVFWAVVFLNTRVKDENSGI